MGILSRGIKVLYSVNENFHGEGGCRKGDIVKVVGDVGGV